jgi:hypothetical protein
MTEIWKTVTTFVCRECDSSFEASDPKRVWTGNVCEYECAQCTANAAFGIYIQSPTTTNRDKTMTTIDQTSSSYAIATELLAALKGLDDRAILICPNRKKQSAKHGKQGANCEHCPRCIAQTAIANAEKLTAPEGS